MQQFTTPENPDAPREKNADSKDPRVAETIARLQTGEVDVAEECDEIWAAAREGEHRYLFELAQELERSEAMRMSPLGMIGAIGSLVTEVEQAIVSIPGADCVEVLFRFAELEQRNSLSHAPGRVDRRRLFASRLVLNQPRHAVLEVMERQEENPAAEGLLYLLVQELVVQGYRQDDPLLQRLRERMLAAGHPLGWLPLRLTALEKLRADSRQTRAVHQYRVYASKTQTPWGPCLSHGAATPPPRGSIRIANYETTTGDDHQRLNAAVANWCAESKGKTEARVFALADPIDADAVDRAFFFRLHTCKCLDLPKGPKDFLFEPVDAAQAFTILFRAAANGGELNEGCFGAYGRHRAWQSLGALVGTSDFATIEEVTEVAQRTHFFFFAARSEWFYGVGEEFGLLALRPNGHSVAFLAATDTD